jgi:uncharacterized protein YjbI with pentapeptide repeats
MKILNISIILVLLIYGLGCGSSSKSSNEAEKKSPSQQEVQDSSTSKDESKNEDQRSTNLSNLTLSECIDANIKIYSTTKENLKTLKCQSLKTKDFQLLSDLSSLEELQITDTPLNGTNINLLQANINKKQLKKLNLSNDNLIKASADMLDPDFPQDYDESKKHYINVDELNLSDNKIEGLYVLDFFPNVKIVDLSGNIFPDIRLHHIQNRVKILNISKNPNIRNLNDFINQYNHAYENIEMLDISYLRNLSDISALREFRSLKKLYIDANSKEKFKNEVDLLIQRGVEVFSY